MQSTIQTVEVPTENTVPMRDKLKITFDQFLFGERMHKYMARDISVDDIGIEYKAFLGFLDIASDEEITEFMTKGRITIGEYILTGGLKIHKKSEHKDGETSDWDSGGFDCTDGGSGGLPYFDKIIQKYLYLKHSPENIIKIATRNRASGVCISNMAFGAGAGAATVTVTGNVTLPTPEEPTADIDYTRVKSDLSTMLSCGSTFVKINNIPELDRKVWMFWDGYEFQKKGKKTWLVRIPTVGYINNNANSMMLRRLQYFRRFYLEMTKRKAMKKGFEWKPEFDDALICLLEISRKNPGMSVFDFGNVKSPKIVKYLMLPVYVNITYLEAIVGQYNIYDVIRYYEDNMENAKKDFLYRTIKKKKNPVINTDMESLMQRGIAAHVEDIAGAMTYNVALPEPVIRDEYVRQRSMMR